MELANNKIRTLFNGLSHISVDSEKRVQRRLPLLSGVRVRRTLKDLEGANETLTDAINTVEKEVEDKQNELLKNFKEERITKDEFNEKSEEIIEQAEDELEPVLEKKVNVTFSDIVTLEDVEKIDSTLTEGVPSGVAEAIFVLEEIHEEINKDADK